MIFKRWIDVSIIISLLVLPVYSTVLISDSFDYADGSIVGQTPSSGIGGTWAVHSGTNNPPLVSSEALVINQDNGAQDVNSTFATSVTSGDLFYAFDFSVSALDPVGDSGSDFEYFSHFLSGTTTFAGQLHIVDSSSGDYTLSISNTGTEESDWGSALDFGTSYRAVVGYNFTTRVSTLWVDPVNELDVNVVSSPRSSAISPTAFAFRQSASSADELVTVDNLIVATTFSEVVPEPSSIALIFLGMSGLLIRRVREA